MRYATACVICAGQLPSQTRADCRYCGVRCRSRAYRIRSDGGGLLRSDAQRRDYHDLQERLRDAQGLAIEREHSLAEATEWATLLEQEEAPLRAERERLRQDLAAARHAATAHHEALITLQATTADQGAEAAAKLAEVHAITERTTEELQRTKERFAQVEQTLQGERVAGKQAVADLSQRCTDKDREVERLKKLAAEQRQEIQELRAADERMARDRLKFRRAIEDLQTEVAEANEHIEALGRQQDKLQGDVEYWQWHARPPRVDSSQTAGSGSVSAASEKELARLRGTVAGLTSDLATANKQNSELLSEVEQMRAKLVTAETEQATVQAHAVRLSAELEKAQARIRDWTHGEISQIGIAAAQGAAKVAAVYFVTKTDPDLVRETLARPQSPVASGAPPAPIASFPDRLESSQPAPMPSGAPATSGMPSRSVQFAAPSPAISPAPPMPPAAKPQALDEDQVWRKRIRDAKGQGWSTFGDQLFMYKRDVLKDQDRLAKEQLQRGVATTAKRLPEGADLEYLGIRAAIDARMAYHRQHGARWEIEYFRLDEASEKKLRRDAMMSAAKARRA